ncbi:MAG: ATP-binding protein [Methylococcales bacterium]|nr:ATP-binding protein [Methylococcales bacterium]
MKFQARYSAMLCMVCRETAQRECRNQTKTTEPKLIPSLVEQAHTARISMLGQLSAALAHELNQPLNAILNNAQAAQRFLRRNPANLADLTNILDDIVKNTLRAGDIVHHLRALVKKQEAVRQAQDINTIIHEAAQMLRCELIGQQVSLHLNLADTLPPVWGDAVQLLQVTLNLLTNGIEALAPLEKSRRHIEVSTACVEASHIEVSVADTGQGLDPAQLDLIFSPFNTSKPDGLGMGLAICCAIVDNHGGRLWATNKPDGGACFHFTLPIRK